MYQFEWNLTSLGAMTSGWDSPTGTYRWLAEELNFTGGNFGSTNY
jgi:hypothetical protein